MEKLSLNPMLEGKRIYIKKHSIDLAELMFSYVDEDKERLACFMPWVQFVKNTEAEKNYILSTHIKWEEGTGFDYGIFLKDDTYIGNIGVHTIKWEHHSTELGYWILGKYEGQGFMSEAVRLLEGHLFEVGFHRVQIRCSDLNSRSERVPKNCGYTYEGTAREDAIEQGKYRNTKTFAKLSTD